MIVKLEIFYKLDVEKTTDFKKVKAIAGKLLNFMNSPDIIKKIRNTDKKGAASKQIQDILLPKTKELHFISEKKGLFKDYLTTGLRPDYFNEELGILIEVERGKTTTNNMDLLDIWKCHICKEANYLFLIVPQLREAQNKQEFNIVVKRVSSFFKHKENHINIDGVFVFGY